MKYTTRNAYIAIENRAAFKTAGSLIGTLSTDGGSGMLAPEWRSVYYAAQRLARNSGGTLYTVYSYATPIAWVLNIDGETLYYVPDIRYSNTTSRHQHQARYAFHGAELITSAPSEVNA